MRKRHSLFTVDLHGRTLIPKVQLTEAGDVDLRIAALQRPLLVAGLDGWSLWAWLTNPTGLLNGGVPADIVTTNGKRACKAAQRYASELLDAQGSVE